MVGKKRAATKSSQKSSVYHGSFTDGYSPYRTFVKRVPLPPLKRERTSGLVGPELDFSATRNIIPKDIYFRYIFPHRHVDAEPTAFQRLAEELHHLTWWDEKRVARDDAYGRRYAETRPKPGFMNTSHWGSYEVGLWTRLASWVGIHYSGKTGYKIPKNPQGVRLKEDQPFKEAKKYGMVPCHIRSEKSRKERAARRVLKRKMRKHVPHIETETGHRFGRAVFKKEDKDAMDLLHSVYRFRIISETLDFDNPSKPVREIVRSPTSSLPKSEIKPKRCIPLRNDMHIPVIVHGKDQEFAKVLGGLTFYGPPPVCKDWPKYRYFYRKNGYWKVSEHHPYGDEVDYFKSTDPSLGSFLR